jgi:hypothetical protein
MTPIGRVCTDSRDVPGNSVLGKVYLICSAANPCALRGDNGGRFRTAEDAEARKRFGEASAAPEFHGPKT